METEGELYEDLIGREVPRDFEDIFSNFFQVIYEKKYHFIKFMQVAHEIQSTKSTHNCALLLCKTFYEFKKRHECMWGCCNISCNHDV